MSFPCCNNNDCPICHGTGIAHSYGKELARDVLLMISVSDLNQDDCRKRIRELADYVLSLEA